MTLLDRRKIRRYIGSGFDNTPVPPIIIVVPPTNDPPGGPPILRGNVGQQVSAIAYAHNVTGQELAGLVHIINSSNSSKVRVDNASLGIINATILDDTVITELTGTIGGVAIPTIFVTGLTNSVGTLTISVNPAKCGTVDTANYPLRLDITDLRLRSVANGGNIADPQGDDIVITSDLAGTTAMNYDPLILWNPVTGRVVTNVKIPTLSHTAPTVFYVQAGKAGVTTFQGGAIGAAWDANFKSVYALGNGTTIDLHDLTANNNILTNFNNVAATIGPNCSAADFSNAIALLQQLQGANILNIATPTVEVWVKLAAYPAGPGTVTGLVDSSAGTPLDKNIGIRNDGKVEWYVFDTGANILVSTSAISLNVWHYIVGRDDASFSSLFIDAISAITPAASSATFAGYTTHNLQIEGQGHSSGSMNGLYAEIRFSNIARSDSYLIATYNNISSPSTFYTVT